MSIILSSLIYYPIKACRGFEVDSAEVERMGLQHDRRMMVTTPEGEFLTQLEFPRLALVTPTLKDGTLELSAPDFDSLRLNIQTTGTSQPVTVWHSKGMAAIDQGEDAANWFSDWLGTEVGLMHIADGFQRRLNPRYCLPPVLMTAYIVASNRVYGKREIVIKSATPVKRFVDPGPGRRKPPFC